LFLRPHVEQQELGRFAAYALNVNLAWAIDIDVCAIALTQKGVSDLDLRSLLWLRALAHDDLRKDFPRSLSNKLVRDALARREDGCVHGQISLQANRMLRVAETICVLHDAAKLVGLLLVGEHLGLIVWLQGALVWLGPDLQEMYLIVAIPVVFRVPNTRTGACELYLAALEVLEVAHTVFVFEHAVHDVAEDEELGVGVCAEAGAGLHPVFVDYAQRTEGLVSWVIVRCEGKGVERVQPAMVCLASGGPRSLVDLHGGWDGGGGRHCADGGFGGRGKEDAAKGAGESQGDC
jgi:hypothetical protein